MRFPAIFLLAAFCATLGLSIAWLKVTRLAVPLDPAAETIVWDVEARISFEGRAKPAKIELTLPRKPAGFSVLDEDFVSRGFGLAVHPGDNGGTRQAVWTTRRAKGTQALYYHIKLYPKRAEPPGKGGPPPVFPAVPEYAEPLSSAVRTVLEQVRAQSADVATYTALLLATLNGSDNENAKVIRKSAPGDAWPRLLTKMLAGARIPSRVVYGLTLENEFVDIPLSPWLQVHDGERWRGFNPATGDEGYPPNFLLWSYADPKVAFTTGVHGVELGFSGAKTPLLQSNVTPHGESLLDRVLLSVSLHELPVRTQNVYRVLLMVPLGAFVILLMRMVIGVPTFGTFMPVLVALAFRETKLVAGVVLFLIVVSIGLAIRVALAQLRLLLMPRLASVLVIVIGLMLTISLISASLGIEQGLSVALFPMVILTMTIERMSIVWDERGPATAVKEFAGSLGVAIAGYFAMTEEHLVYLMSVFPELLLVVLAGCLAFGAYTGYRLSEILRFKDLAGR